MSPIKVFNGRNTLVFLFFLFVSVCLWLLQALNEQYETVITVDVTVTGVPQGVVVEPSDDIEIGVVVRDWGTELAKYNFGGNAGVNVDFSEFVNNKGRLSLPLASLENRVAGLLPSSMTLLRFDGDSLLLSVKKGKVVRPLKLNYRISTAKHVELLDVEVEPQTVSVVALTSQIEQIEEVELPFFELNNVKSDTVVPMLLKGVEYVEYDPAVVEVKVSVADYVKNVARVPVTLKNSNGLLREDIPYDIPEFVTVAFYAPQSARGSYSDSMFTVTFDCNETLKEKKDSICLHLASKPSFVDKDDVSLSHKYVYSKKFLKKNVR